MPFLLAEILNFQGSTHRTGVGSFSTLKNECTNLYEYDEEEALYQAVEEFAYVEYNYVRPHSYNGYATPHEARVNA